MMQIKVRAWDNVANEMHYAGEDIDLIFILGSEGIECTDIREMTSNGEGVHSMDHLIYMQNTGLKDKNGAEIYEGDVLHIDKRFNGSDIYGKVYRKGAGYALITRRGSDTSQGYLEIVTPYTEVIGNIYEHPQLLEGGEPDAS